MVEIHNEIQTKTSVTLNHADMSEVQNFIDLQRALLLRKLRVFSLGRL